MARFPSLQPPAEVLAEEAPGFLHELLFQSIFLLIGCLEQHRLAGGRPAASHPLSSVQGEDKYLELIVLCHIYHSL